MDQGQQWDLGSQEWKCKKFRDLEINEKIQTYLLLYKPVPKKLNIVKIQKFSLFFYKYIFLFLKKKTF